MRPGPQQRQCDPRAAAAGPQASALGTCASSSWGGGPARARRPAEGGSRACRPARGQAGPSSGAQCSAGPPEVALPPGCRRRHESGREGVRRAGPGPRSARPRHGLGRLGAHRCAGRHGSKLSTAPRHSAAPRPFLPRAFHLSSVRVCIRTYLCICVCMHTERHIHTYTVCIYKVCV